jgi:hypothetical protein
VLETATPWSGLWPVATSRADKNLSFAAITVNWENPTGRYRCMRTARLVTLLFTGSDKH